MAEMNANAAVATASDCNKDIATAKAEFKRTLYDCNGEVAHPDVKNKMDHLISLADKKRGDGDEVQWSPAQDMNINAGRWKILSAPTFPGGLSSDAGGKDCGRRKYSLGRMSFGMFCPKKAVCALDGIINIIEPLKMEDENKNFAGGDVGDGVNGATDWKQTYDVHVTLDIYVPDTNTNDSNNDSDSKFATNKMPAKLCNFGVCSPQSATRLGVKFSGGTLQPNFDLNENSALLATWKQVFENAQSKEKSQQSYLSKIAIYIQHALMNYVVGLEAPVDVGDYSQTYKIERPYNGHLDILYIDEDLRITKGNRGSIVVVERLKN